MSGDRPRIAVLFNAPVLPPGHPDADSESDVVGVARVVAEALGGSGFEATQVAARPPVKSVLEALERVAPDVIFNLIEGFGGRSVGATNLTALLDLTGIPYTGSPAEALAACLSKGHAKGLLRGFGLPTAPFLFVGPGQSLTGWDWPGAAIVKPDCEDGSLGIDQASVVNDLEAARALVASLQGRYGGAALIEAYLPGREFNVGVLALPDPEPLPIAEVAYESARTSWPILTYSAKWSSGSDEDRASPIRCPARIDAALADELGRLAIAAFRVTGCRDYARVDFRLDESGAPTILEINPNPDIGPTAGWARALRKSGRDYAATVAALARQALGRPRSVGPAEVAMTGS